MKTKQVYKKRETLMGWAFVLPFLILFTVFIIYPVVQGVWVSLNDWSLMGRLRFIGLGNYQKMLGDKNFWEALQHKIPENQLLSSGNPFCLSRFVRRAVHLRAVPRTDQRDS